MKIYQPLNDWKYFQKKDRILVVPSACQHFSTESSDTNRLQVNMNCITPIHLIFSRSTFIGIVSNHEQQPVAGQVLQTYLVTGPMSRFCSDLLPMYRVLAADNVKKLKLDEKVPAGTQTPRSNIFSMRFFKTL